MELERMIDNYKCELKKLERFLVHIPVMKANAGLPDEMVNELQERVTREISNCEFNITEIEKKLYEFA